MCGFAKELEENIFQEKRWRKAETGEQ